MTFIFGLLIFWCGAFVGAIVAGMLIGGKRDEYPHSDFTGEP